MGDRYLHLNNDDPGTDNGRADWSLTLVQGLEVGSHVEAGQHIGYVGDSGNAEWTGSHTHFELAHDGGRSIPTRSSKMPMRGRSPCALPRPKGP